jgi:hypothetical protein
MTLVLVMFAFVCCLFCSSNTLLSVWIYTYPAPCLVAVDLEDTPIDNRTKEKRNLQITSMLSNCHPVPCLHNTPVYSSPLLISIYLLCLSVPLEGYTDWQPDWRGKGILIKLDLLTVLFAFLSAVCLFVFLSVYPLSICCLSVCLSQLSAVWRIRSTQPLTARRRGTITRIDSLPRLCFFVLLSVFYPLSICCLFVVCLVSAALGYSDWQPVEEREGCDNTNIVDSHCCLWCLPFFLICFSIYCLSERCLSLSVGDILVLSVLLMFYLLFLLCICCFVYGLLLAVYFVSTICYVTHTSTSFIFLAWAMGWWGVSSSVQTASGIKQRDTTKER